jgi:N6-adenosine-specific RNA methylase IME4
MGPGYRVRTIHEPILVCTIGSPKHRAFPSFFDGIAREHSRKPDELYDLVSKHTPDAFRCDLFARRTRSGFEGWGFEATKFDEAASR